MQRLLKHLHEHEHHQQGMEALQEKRCYKPVLETQRFSSFESALASKIIKTHPFPA